MPKCPRRSVSDRFSRASVGGFDLAARWMGWETAWFSEIDPYASAVLAKHWPGVPNHGDITKIDFSTVEPVDMLCGGFPCQDISNAGKRAGIDGSRSGLWNEFARAIGSLLPEWVVVENVAALLRRGYPVVRRDLRTLGYRVARPVVMSATAVAAPHLRERLWIVARKAVADAQRQGLAGRHVQRTRQETVFIAANGGYCRGSEFGQAWRTEPDVGRVAYGVPAGVDRIRGLGNAIVPQCAFEIFKAIEARETEMRWSA